MSNKIKLQQKIEYLTRHESMLMSLHLDGSINVMEYAEMLLAVRAALRELGAEMREALMALDEL
jgi:DNA-binding HxlR family transcriptional regulator